MGGVRIRYLIFLWKSTFFSDNNEKCDLIRQTKKTRNGDSYQIPIQISDIIDNKDNNKFSAAEIPFPAALELLSVNYNL